MMTVSITHLLTLCYITLITLQTSPGQIATINLSISKCTFTFTQSSSTVNFHYCQQDTYNSNNWISCFSRCCSSDQLSQYNVPSLIGINFCIKVNMNSSTPLSALVISFIVVFSLVGISLAIFLYVCWQRYRVRPMMQVLPTPARVSIQMAEIIDVEWPDETDINFGKEKQILWSNQAKNSNPLALSDQKCSICFQQANKTAQTICGHQHHPICLGKWFQNNTYCPYCRHPSIRGIKIYCSKCRWRYYVVTRTMLSAIKKELPEKCGNCIKEEVKMHQVGEFVADGSINELGEASAYQIQAKNFEAKRFRKLSI